MKLKRKVFYMVILVLCQVKFCHLSIILYYYFCAVNLFSVCVLLVLPTGASIILSSTVSPAFISQLERRLKSTFLQSRLANTRSYCMQQLKLLVQDSSVGWIYSYLYIARMLLILVRLGMFVLPSNLQVYYFTIYVINKSDL